MVAVVVVTGLVAGACGAAPAAGPVQTSEHATTTTTVVRRIARDTSNNVVSEHIMVPYEAVLYAAPSAVVGTVTAVDGPFWNAADGQKWTSQPDDYTSPGLYREVTIDVEQVIRDELGLPPGRVEFVTLGGGDGSQDRNALLGGDFRVGDRVLVLLYTEALPMRERLLFVYEPFYQFQGVYHIVPSPEGDRVLSSRDYYATRHPRVVIGDDEPPPPPVEPGPLLTDFVADLTAMRERVDERWEVYRPKATYEAAVIANIMTMLETGTYRNVELPSPSG